MRLIDADALIKSINKDTYVMPVAAMINTIKYAPTIHPVQTRLRATWLNTGEIKNPFRCSNCKDDYAKLSDYCPTCGAIMDYIY